MVLLEWLLLDSILGLGFLFGGGGGLDVDLPTGELCSQTCVLALLANGQRQLVVRNDDAAAFTVLEGGDADYISRGESGSDILGILSNFTGEVFHALKEATIMSPELDAKVDSLDLDMVRYGVSNLKKSGFNRALYIGHALRMFDRGDERTRLSYCQGVIFGGVALSLGEYCRTRWTGCKTAVIVADEKVMDLYKTIISECDEIDEVLQVTLTPTKSYALEGFRKIINLRNGK